MTLISFFVKSAGFVRRLIWPGLLLMSLASNLLFAGLYVYHNWGWKVHESPAAVLLWSAEWVGLCRVHWPEGHSATPENIIFLAVGYVLGRAQMSADRFSAPYLHAIGVSRRQYGKNEYQVIHDGLKKYFGFCGMASFCLGLSLLLYEHRCMCNWFKRLKCCTDACWHFKYWSVKCAIVMYCSVDAAQTQRAMSYLLTVTV